MSNDRLLAAGLGIAAGYALARAMDAARNPGASSSGPFLYQPPPGAIAALADVAAALYPNAAPAIRAAARSAELLQPPARAWLLEHRGRYAITTCAPPPGATIVAVATGRTPADAIAALKP